MFKDVQLKRQQKSDIMMHRTTTIIVISLVKYHHWVDMKFKLLVQGVHQVKIIQQLSETLFFRKQVSNM